MDRIGVRIDVTSNFSQLSGDINNANSSLTAFLANSSKIDEFSLAREQIRQDRINNNTPAILDANGNPYQTEISRNQIETNAAQIPLNPNIDKPLIDVIRESTDSIVSVLRKISTPESGADLPAVTGTDATGSEKSESKEKSLIEKLLVGGGSAYLVRGTINAGLDVARNVVGIDIARTDKQIAAMQGDVYGVQRAELSENKALERSVSTGLGGIIAPLVGTIIGAFTPVGAVAGGLIGNALGSLGKTVADSTLDISQQKEESQIKLAESMSALYKDLLPTYQSSIAAFYNTSGTNAEFFDAKTTELSNIFESGAKNTRLDTATFANLATELSKYGVDNAGEATDLTRQAALYAAYTNGDVGQFNQFAGLQSRYNGEKGINLDYAYGAARASGLDRAQFGEFLQGLERVVSSGISKGFVQSTDEIANTLVMFSDLSGGSEFWKGENAAERLEKLNSGLENATGLKNTTDILTYKAFVDNNIAIGEGNTAYIGGGSVDANILNTFAAMEGGLNAENFKAIAQSFSGAYEGDLMSNVAAWKELSGLNWTGAMQLYNMQQELLGNGYDETTLAENIKSLMESPESSDNARDMQNWQNVLSQLAAEFGQHYYAEELQKIEANTEELKGILNENAEKWIPIENQVKEGTKNVGKPTLNISEEETEKFDYQQVGAASFVATPKADKVDHSYLRNLGDKPYMELFLNTYKNDDSFLGDVARGDLNFYDWAKTKADDYSFEPGKSAAEIEKQFLRYADEIFRSLKDSNPNNDEITTEKYGSYADELIKLFKEQGLVASINELKDIMTDIDKQLKEGIQVG